MSILPSLEHADGGDVRRCRRRRKGWLQVPRLSFSSATPGASERAAMDVKNKVCINFASKDFSSKDFSLTRDFIAGTDAGKKKKRGIELLGQRKIWKVDGAQTSEAACG